MVIIVRGLELRRILGRITMSITGCFSTTGQLRHHTVEHGEIFISSHTELSNRRSDGGSCSIKRVFTGLHGTVSASRTS